MLAKSRHSSPELPAAPAVPAPLVDPEVPPPATPLPAAPPLAPAAPLVPAAHPEEFGGAPTRVYELVTSEERLAGKERDELVRELGRAAATPDWFDWAKRLRAQGKPVVHYRGELATSLMKAQLATVAERLKAGESSEVTFVDGRPHVVRLVSVSPGVHQRLQKAPSGTNNRR